MKTRLAVAGSVLVLAFGIGACSASGSDEDQLSKASESVGASEARSADGGDSAQVAATETAGSVGDGQSTATVAPVPRLDQKVIKNADLRVELRPDSFRTAFSAAASIAESNGGFVADSQTSGSGDDGARGTLTIRIPAARFDAARTALAELGELEEESISGQDVTGQLTDVDARLRNLRSQEEALRLLMTKAVNVGETMQVQQQLFAVREQVEQLAGQQTQLTDAVSFATVRVSLFEPGASLRPDDSEPTSLGEALERAWDGAVTVVGTVVIGLGYLVPLAALALLGWLVWRRSRGAVTAPAGSSAAG